MAEPVRVLIADDHTIVRSGLNLLLSSEPDLEVVGEASNGTEAVEMASRLRPDVVLMDVGMPALNGVDATRQIKQRLPGCNVLILTMHRSDEYFFETLEAGGSGYILKGAETGELIQAVRAVARGDVFLYPSMARVLVQQYVNPSGAAPADHGLTPREFEIMKMIAEGFSYREIADKLVVSPSTVHSHRTNLMHKLGLSTRHDLVQYARQRGLIRDS